MENVKNVKITQKYQKTKKHVLKLVAMLDNEFRKKEFASIAKITTSHHKMLTLVHSLFAISVKSYQRMANAKIAKIITFHLQTKKYA